jgi:hypothetical protein
MIFLRSLLVLKCMLLDTCDNVFMAKHFSFEAAAPSLANSLVRSLNGGGGKGVKEKLIFYDFGMEIISDFLISSFLFARFGISWRSQRYRS